MDGTRRARDEEAGERRRMGRLNSRVSLHPAVK